MTRRHRAHRSVTVSVSGEWRVFNAWPQSWPPSTPQPWNGMNNQTQSLTAVSRLAVAPCLPPRTRQYRVISGKPLLSRISMCSTAPERIHPLRGNLTVQWSMTGLSRPSLRVSTCQLHFFGNRFHFEAFCTWEEMIHQILLHRGTNTCICYSIIQSSCIS